MYNYVGLCMGVLSLVSHCMISYHIRVSLAIGHIQIRFWKHMTVW